MRRSTSYPAVATLVLMLAGGCDKRGSAPPTEPSSPPAKTDDAAEVTETKAQPETPPSTDDAAEVTETKAQPETPSSTDDETASLGHLVGTQIGEADGIGLISESDGSDKSPHVRLGRANVQGVLDRQIVRRIVRSHIREVKACYERGLTNNPSLKGRVAIGFEIDAEGRVGNAQVHANDSNDASVATCIAEAVEQWKFPKPNGGEVVRVTFPFDLRTE